MDPSTDASPYPARAPGARSARRVSCRAAGLALAIAAAAVAAPASPALADDPGPVASAAAAADVLKRKDRGTDVAALQRRLGVTADGVFGPDTEAAVKRYQSRHGLEVDGIVGPVTRRSLGLRAFHARNRTRTTTRRGRSNRYRISASVRARLERIAACESGGNPRALSPGGTYRGKYQFLPSTWASVGGRGDPARASEAEQDRRAAILLARTGGGAWPNC
jgi:hypothetical protein